MNWNWKEFKKQKTLFRSYYCLIKKEGGASGSVSFLEQQKWYKRYWKINLNEWLENFSQLPVNADCARKWQKDSQYLDNCQCLEAEAQEIY